MTLTYEAEVVSRRPVHVLIVGVGWSGTRDESKQPVQDSGLKLLPGLEMSVDRAAAFWAGATPRLVGAATASVEVLYSGRDETLRTTGLSGERVDPANAVNVAKAFSDWVERCAKAPNSLAIVHWLGHGAAARKPRVPNPGSEDMILYLEDPYPGSAVGAMAISLSKTLEALRHGRFALDCICFIDACRDARGSQTNCPAAWPSNFEEDADASNVVCFTLAYDAKPALCRPLPAPRAGFLGGAVITEAILDALEHFGGDRVDGITDAIVRPLDMMPTINERLDWWRSEMHIPKMTQVVASGDSDFGLLRIKHRRCMVQVRSKGRDSIEKLHLSASLGPEAPGGPFPREAMVPHDDGMFRAEVLGGEWWVVKGETDQKPYPPFAQRQTVEANPPKCEERWR